jgi:hypothetical protein
MLRNVTLHMQESAPLRVLEVEEEPSGETVTFSGRHLLLRRVLDVGQVESWIPEEMIVRIEEED